MGNPELVTFVAEAHPPLAEALCQAARDTQVGRRAAEEALITGLTRWKQVARTASPIGWCYLRGLEELRAAGVGLAVDDQDILAADDVEAAARRIQDLRDPAAPPPPRIDSQAVVQRASKRRSVQTLIGMTIALAGVTGLALLLAWLQSPTF